MSGCREESEPVVAVGPTNDEIVIENAYLIRDAAEAFAADNGGIYSSHRSEILPYLPGGEVLMNPFTGIRSEPGIGLPGDPGELGYWAVLDSTGADKGYSIYGVGEDRTFIIEIHKLP